MELNFLPIILSAIIPMIIGSIWYNPKVLGSAWMNASKLDEDFLSQGNMLVIFGVSFVMCILIAFALSGMVVHQSAIYSVLFGEPGFGQEGSETMQFIEEFNAKYGDNHRGFRHGALHGVFAALFFAVPVITVISLFERRGFKYIAIHGGYWIISLALMGGVICAYA